MKSGRLPYTTDPLCFIVQTLELKCLTAKNTLAYRAVKKVKQCMTQKIEKELINQSICSLEPTTPPPPKAPIEFPLSLFSQSSKINMKLPGGQSL
jgi:hypothetical protein